VKARWRYSDIVKAAEQRIRDRYASPYRYVGITEAPCEVATNLVETDQLRQAVNLPVPTVRDVMDALTLVTPARAAFAADMEGAELTLIEAARHAGVGWNEIGDALGYAPAGAGVSAKHRYRTLQAKFPSRAPRAFTMDINTVAPTSSDAETSAESAATGR
jgi:hypothetical protein